MKTERPHARAFSRIMPLLTRADRSLGWPLLGTWLALAAVAMGLALPTVRDTGLDYDEALYGHLAKDFLQDRHCLQHMPGSSSVNLGDRPFPVFVQGYLGAVKCWLLLPSFAIWGSTVAVMRFTLLAWGLLGVLFLMLWVQRVRGNAEAVLVGLLTVFDPSFFFPTVCDWGAFVPSFLFRCAGLFFAGLWWNKRQTRWLALAGATFGLGFFNKIDFAVFLLALGIATVLSQPRRMAQSFRRETRQWLVAGIAFLLTGSLMVVSCFRWLQAILAVPAGAQPGQFVTKLHIAGALLDGSYFSRLMKAGGLFDKMFESPPFLLAPFAVVLLLSATMLVIQAVRNARSQRRPWAIFVLGGLGISIVGVFVLPDAVRIHHLLLIYPFPQLVIAAAATQTWHLAHALSPWRHAGRGVAVCAVLIVIAWNFVAVRKTQAFVATTGGRGTWSKALAAFSREIRTREDLVVASLDWGFHEQLSFLTDGPKLYELTWNIQQGRPVSLLRETNFIYLVHPPEFSLFDYGQQYLAAARQADPGLAVHSRTNLEDRVVFQYFSFTGR
jgi:hypothetical protein